MKSLVLSVCLLACAAACTAKEPEFRTAKVIAQNISSYNAGTAAMPMGTMVVGVPITRRENFVVLETEHTRLSLSEFVTRRGPVVLTVHGMVQFYQDGNWIVILDTNRKKHKFSIVHAEALDDPPKK